MQQVILLSPADRTAVEVSLGRLIGNAYGVMATWPLYCVGELHTSDPSSMVLERYDIWRSCLVVVREVLRSASASEAVGAQLDALFSAIDGIRESFLTLMQCRTMPPGAVRATYTNLVDAYANLLSGISEVSREFELGGQILPAENSLKRVCFVRSLTHLGNELPGGPNGERGTKGCG